MLSDITPTDYLGWGSHGVAGYIGNALGRDLNSPARKACRARPSRRPSASR